MSRPDCARGVIPPSQIFRTSIKITPATNRTSKVIYTGTTNGIVNNSRGFPAIPEHSGVSTNLRKCNGIPTTTPKLSRTSNGFSNQNSISIEDSNHNGTSTGNWKRNETCTETDNQKGKYLGIRDNKEFANSNRGQNGFTPGSKGNMLIATVKGEKVGAGSGIIYASVKGNNPGTSPDTGFKVGDPNVKKLVYNMYRGLLNTKHERANDIVDAAPKQNIHTDDGVSERVAAMMKQQEELKNNKMSSAGGAPPPPPPPFKFPGMVIPQPRPPPSVISEPPPPTMASIQKAKMPAALAGAMMKDKKPFTYTPGGLDLSEIKSPSMQRRLQRNASLEGVKPSPLAQQPSSQTQNSSPLPPQGMIQVLPMPGIGMAPAVKIQAKEPRKSSRTVCGPAPLPPPFACGAEGSAETVEVEQKKPIDHINSNANNTENQNNIPHYPKPDSKLPPNGINSEVGTLEQNISNNISAVPNIPLPPPIPSSKRKYVIPKSKRENEHDFIDLDEIEKTIKNLSSELNNKEIEQNQIDRKFSTEENVVKENIADCISENADCSSPFYPDDQNSFQTTSDQSQDIASSSDADHNVKDMSSKHYNDNNRWNYDESSNAHLRQALQGETNIPEQTSFEIDLGNTNADPIDASIKKTTSFPVSIEVETESMSSHDETLGANIHSNDESIDYSENEKNVSTASNTNDITDINGRLSKEAFLPTTNTMKIIPDTVDNELMSLTLNHKNSEPQQVSQQKQYLEMDKPLPWMLGMKTEPSPAPVPDFINRANTNQEKCQRQISLPQNSEVQQLSLVCHKEPSPASNVVHRPNTAQERFQHQIPSPQNNEVGQFVPIGTKDISHECDFVHHANTAQEIFQRQTSLPQRKDVQQIASNSTKESSTPPSDFIHYAHTAPERFQRQMSSPHNNEVQQLSPICTKESSSTINLVHDANMSQERFQRQTSLPQHNEVHQSAPWRHPHHRSSINSNRNRSISPISMQLNSEEISVKNETSDQNRPMVNMSHYATLPSNHRNKSQQIHFQNNTVPHNNFAHSNPKERIIPIMLETSPPTTPQRNFESFNLNSSDNIATHFNSGNNQISNSYTNHPYPGANNFPMPANQFSPISPPSPLYSINATEALHQIQHNLNQLNNGLKTEEANCQNGPSCNQGVNVMVMNDSPAVQSKSFNIIQKAYESPSSTDSNTEEPRKYTGSNIPSRSFKVLQAMTDSQGWSRNHSSS